MRMNQTPCPRRLSAWGGTDILGAPEEGGSRDQDGRHRHRRNSLITDKEHQARPDQYQACSETCRHIAPLLGMPDLRLVITHGNGPQVGFILRRSELASKELHAVPLDSCVADTQGASGTTYSSRSSTSSGVSASRRLWPRWSRSASWTGPIPRFEKPDKPIGSFLSKEQAELHARADGWDLVETQGADGGASSPRRRRPRSSSSAR